jgi:hypothetical protein
VSGHGRARRLRQRLGERDIDVLQSLQEFRLMTGGQLRRLHFPDGQPITQARKARATLQRLSDWNAIVRLDRRRRVGGSQRGSDGHVYGLSGWGQAVLDTDAEAPRRHRRVVEGKPAFLAHTLAVSEVAVALHEHERAGCCHIDTLRAEPGAWRWFSGIGGQQRVLKPDTFVRLIVEDFELSSFIEVDLATESLPTIGRKLRVYVDYWRSGREQHDHGVFPRVWWLVPDRARLTAVVRVIRHLPHEALDLFRVALQTDVTEVLTQIPRAGAPE